MTVYRVETRILADGVVIDGWDWVPEVRTAPGYRCGSIVFPYGLRDGDPCPWCGTRHPPDVVAVVICPNCNEMYAEDDIVRHWREECGT